MQINNIFYPMWSLFLKSTFLRQLLPRSLRKVIEKILDLFEKLLAFLITTILPSVVHDTVHPQRYRQQTILTWEKHQDRKKNPHLIKVLRSSLSLYEYSNNWKRISVLC